MLEGGIKFRMILTTHCVSVNIHKSTIKIVFFHDIVKSELKTGGTVHDTKRSKGTIGYRIGKDVHQPQRHCIYDLSSGIIVN